MASPQYPPPGDDRSKSKSERLRVERRIEEPVVRRRYYGFGWFWLWIWVWIIIILIVWFGGWGWGSYGGWWWGNRGRAGIVQPVNQITGSGVAVLSATNKQPFIGKQFQIRNVPVQQKSTDQAIWISMSNGTPMLVVLTGNQNTTANANISGGSRVDVTGTVQKPPPAQQAKSQWSLSDEQTNRLEQQGAYIQARQVQAARP